MNGKMSSFLELRPYNIFQSLATFCNVVVEEKLKDNLIYIGFIEMPFYYILCLEVYYLQIYKKLRS